MRKLLFFHAPWCGPCKVYEREIIDPLEALVGPEHIVRIDAWERPQEAKKYGVDRLPYIVILDDSGVMVSRSEGIDIKEVADWILTGTPEQLSGRGGAD